MQMSEYFLANTFFRETQSLAFLGSSGSVFVVSGSLFGAGQFITCHQGEALRLLRERATV